MALTQTLLISSEDLQNYCDFSQFVEDKRVEAVILNAQMLEVRPLLCNPFYAELIDQVKNSTLTYENAELLNGSDDETFFGIKCWLAWQVYAEYLPTANFKSTHSGMKIWNDTTSENATAGALEVMASKARQTADLYKNNVIQFLKDNIDNYPLWEDCNSCGEGFKMQSKLSVINTPKY